MICWGKYPREEGFLGGIQSTRKRGMAFLGVTECLKMNFYGINCIYGVGRITGVYILLLFSPH